MFKKNIISPKAQTYEDYDLLIIGAGFSGAFTAQQACKMLNPGSKIALVDAKGLLNSESSSKNECFKLHTGPHYIGDLETAKKCLRSSVEMAHHFPDYILDSSNPSAPTRRGRHYLMSNSHPIEMVKERCQQLTEYYQHLIKEFPKAKKVFGEPDDFIRYLNPSEYDYVAPEISVKNDLSTPSNEFQKESVILGIETPESQIDIDQFKSFFEHAFKHLEDTLYQFYGHNVSKISYSQDMFHYIVETQYFDHESNKMETKYFRAKSVVNCSWQNIDIIDSNLNFDQVEKMPTSIRAKILIDTPVPKKLAKMNTCIFFSGPHASFTMIPASTTMPEDQLRVTYEPATNIGHYPSGTPHHQVEDRNLRIICNPLTEDEKEERETILKNIAKEILAGASRYIPAIDSIEKVNATNLGFVKIFADTGEDNAYLYDVNSPIHQRRESGIQKRALCYIAFSGVKMSYAFDTAKTVVGLIFRDMIYRAALEDAINTYIRKKLIEVNNSDISSLCAPSLVYAAKEYCISVLTHPKEDRAMHHLKKEFDALQNISLPDAEPRNKAIYSDRLSSAAADLFEKICQKLVEQYRDVLSSHSELKGLTAYEDALYQNLQSKAGPFSFRK